MNTASDHTLYARWTANTYTVTFNYNDGVTSNTSTLVTYDSAYGTLPNPTRAGYTFTGWYTSGGSNILSTTKVTTSSNHTIYAQWVANKYTVTFEVPVGGSPNQTSMEVTYGKPYGTMPTATSDWWSGTPFLGWFDEGAGYGCPSGYTCTNDDNYGNGYGNKITETTIVSIASNHTLYGAFSYWCFVAGTQVLTENGYKNMEDIKTGEFVYTMNLDTNELELKEVTGTIISHAFVTYKMTIEDKIVEMSDKHELYIIDKGWVRAYNVQVGDGMLDANGNEIEISNIERKIYKEAIPTYNLTVDGNHNFFVTNIQVLVHNANSK